MKYEELTAELDRVFPLGVEFVSDVKPFTFEDAVKMVSDAHNDLIREEHFLCEFLCEFPDADEEDFKWSIFLRDSLGYSKESISAMIERYRVRYEQVISYVIEKGVWF